jgi:hypothetical protein
VRLRPPSRLARRIAFWLYAAALFTATHWPGLAVESDVISRPDLAIHVAAFALWTIALACTAYLGPPLAPRTIALAAPIAAVFALLDEATQAIPLFMRTFDPLDLAADLAGVAVGAGALAACRALRARRSPPA